MAAKNKTIRLLVSDVSGVNEPLDVDPNSSHTSFLLALREIFGDCVPVHRPVMGSIVRHDQLIRDACFRVGKVGDANTIAHLGELFFVAAFEPVVARGVRACVRAYLIGDCGRIHGVTASPATRPIRSACCMFDVMVVS